MTVHPSFNNWFEQHRQDFDALVFDIDGVLLAGQTPVPGSGEFVQKLREMNFPFSLLTNDGNHSVDVKCEHLKNCGVEFFPQELTSCSHGLVEVATKLNLAGKLFFIMGDLGEPCYAENVGLVITRDLKELPKCTGVIDGEKNYDWEPVLNAVVNYFIANPNALLIVPNPDEYYPIAGDKIELASGATARLVQNALKAHSISIEPIYLGKPYTPIFEHNHTALEKRLKKAIERKRVVMIGDSLDSDIKGANDFGYRSALVLTGITKAGMLKVSPIKPDLVFERL